MRDDALRRPQVPTQDLLITRGVEEQGTATSTWDDERAGVRFE